jgi:hypothetical protein
MFRDLLRFVQIRITFPSGIKGINKKKKKKNPKIRNPRTNKPIQSCAVLSFLTAMYIN